jgi:hypothetical protein
MSALSSKATRLLVEQRIVPTGRALTFTSKGDSGDYETLVREDGSSACTCPATGPCAHRDAATFLAAAMRDEGLDGVALDVVA